MKKIKILITGLLLSFWLAVPAYADDDGLGVSMRLLSSPDMSADAATKIITLPDSASAVGSAHSEFGLATANEAKSKRGREYGQAKSEAAKIKGGLKRKGPK